MTSTSSRRCATWLAAAIVLGSVTAANAASIRTTPGVMPSPSIMNVQWRHHRHDRNDGAAAAAALLGGLVIGGIIANSAAPPPAYGYPAYPAYSQPYAAPNPHADWCASNTPGYNAYDNTYQGYYAGERIPCRSPYGG